MTKDLIEAVESEREKFIPVSSEYADGVLDGLGKALSIIRRQHTAQGEKMQEVRAALERMSNPMTSYSTQGRIGITAALNLLLGARDDAKRALVLLDTLINLRDGE